MQFEAEQSVRHSDTLEGKNIVISGKFINHSREELKAMIEAHGGKNQSGVNANTDFIVAGENMGPAKLQKAEILGVKILSESEFIELIGGDVVVEQAPTTQAPTASEQVIQTTLF